MEKKFLIEVLRLLATNAIGQIKALPNYVCAPDELALLFDDLENMSLEGIGNQLFQSKVNKLAQAFNEIQQSSESVWTSEALSIHPKWEEVRSAALEALSALGEEYAPPRLSTMVAYVPGKT